MGLLRERCAESRTGHLRYCWNQVWTKNGRRIPWNATAICETFKISCPVIPFGAMVEYHPFSRKDLSRLLQFGPKVLPGVFLGFALHAEEIQRRHLGRRH